ncbi:MAG TPA: M48 family metalloprotease [Nitrospinota bacterium]|nr:M48 family metalloprotease [Nitrospinota bacterium]
MAFTFSPVGFAPSSSSETLEDFLRAMDAEMQRQLEEERKNLKKPLPEKQPEKQKQQNQLEQQRQEEPLGGILGTIIKDKKTKEIIGALGKGIQSLQPIQYNEEKALGGAIATQVFSRFGGSYNNKSLLQYVNLVGNSVAMFSDRSNIPYHFAILNNPEPNAFAAPGGYVFITTGLLRKIKNEAELAGVLGHEIAHISQKHTLRTLQRSRSIQGISELSLSLMDKNPAMFRNIINDISTILFEHGLDQKLEYEADRVGTEFAYRVGYNPRGLNDFLKTLRKIRGKERSIFFKTHPSPSHRINKLLTEVLPNYRGIDKYRILTSRFKVETKGKL